MLPVTVVLAVDKGICCWLLSAAETLGLCLGGTEQQRCSVVSSPQPGDIWLPGRGNTAAFCRWHWLLAKCCSLSRQALLLLPSLGELTVRSQIMTNLLFSHLFLNHCKVEKLQWLSRTSSIYFLHAEGHSWPCIFLNPLLHLCRMGTDFSASEMWLLCKSRVGFSGRTGVSPAH